MATVLNWSERPELHATGLKDCQYSAILMALVGAGFTKFPLGIYTAVEREALERSDNQPNEIGANIDDALLAIKNRYHVVGHRFAYSKAATLTAFLNVPGRVVDLNGKNSAFSTYYRRHDPKFAGAHAGTVVTHGSGALTWFDPEAPNKYKGEPMTVAVAVKWSMALNPGALAWFKVDELKPAPAPTPPPGGPTVTIFNPVRHLSVKGDMTSYLLVGGKLTTPTPHNFGAGSGAACDASTVINTKTYLRVGSGPLKGAWFAAPPAVLDPIVPPTPPVPPAPPVTYTKAQLDAAVAAQKAADLAALAALQSQFDAIKAQAAKDAKQVVDIKAADTALIKADAAVVTANEALTQAISR